MGYWRQQRLIAHDVDVDMSFDAIHTEAIRAAVSAVVRPPLKVVETTSKHRGPKFKITGLGTVGLAIDRPKVSDEGFNRSALRPLLLQRCRGRLMAVLYCRIWKS